MSEHMTDIHPILCVIPARGGSKGLPRKNVLPLGGLPLIGHSLECARRCPIVARTVVSTDDDEIARVARALGGEVPFVRPAELADDKTPTIPVLRHALETAERLDGRAYGSVLLLEPTSPIRDPADLARAAQLLEADASAVGVVACSRPTFNPLWVCVTPRDGAIERVFDVGRGATRRQDLPPVLRINGCLYLWRSEYLRTAPADWLSGGRHVPLEIPESRAFSIDDADELAVLEALVTAGRVRVPWLVAPPQP